MKKIVQNLLMSLLVIVVTSIGMSLTIKANIGLGSINALSGSVSLVTGIKVGTILMGINVLCVSVQFLVQRKHFHVRQWLQVLTAVVLGEVVNIMLYNVMSEWHIDNYMIRICLMIIGITISCFGVGMITQLNLIIFPVEAVANVIASVTKFNFRQVRQMIDALAITTSLCLTVLFHVSFTIREGTVLNFFIFSHIAHFFIEFVKKQGWFETIRIK